MRTFPAVFAAAVLASAAAARADNGPSPDAKTLAYGYAAAFESMNKSSVSIIYFSAGQIETIKDVSQISAFGGVLLIKAFGGNKQILDAARVIKITDA